jgi:hypothetical protein
MFKRISRLKPVFIGMSVLAFLISMPLDHAFAALVDTHSASEELNPNATKDRLLSLLAREEVRIALVRHGISPSEAEARIRAMTDQEATQISQQIDRLPTGGGAYAPAIPVWAVVGGVAIFVLLVILLFLGIYHLAQAVQDQTPKSSGPLPAPPRFAPSPVVNPMDPWTAKWKVTQGQLAGMWVFKQTGDRVISTAESDYVVDAKVTGFTIRGTWSEKIGKAKGDFSATLTEDALSFNADAQYWPRVFFTANRVE